MAQRLAVLAAESQRSWQCCWAHHLPCLAEQALPCTRLWHKLPAAMATPTCPGISCSQMLSGSCVLQASPFIAYSPDVSATSQLGHTQQLPHTCVAAFDVCIELLRCELSASGQCIGDCEVVLRAHPAHCSLLTLPVPDSINGPAKLWTG